MKIEEYRNKEGFIDISLLVDQASLYKKKTSFEYGNDVYFYKNIHEVQNIYNELIAEEIASDLKMEHAHYDLACKESDIGVISKSFLKKNEKIIDMDIILDNVPGYSFYKEEKNNLEDIWDALYKRYSDRELVKSLMDQVVNIFMFDILIGNMDRHTGNIGLIEGGIRPRITPIYDNNEMLSDVCLVFGGYSLAVRREDYFFRMSDTKEDNNFLETFLRMSDSSYLKQFESYLWVISERNILDILQRIRTKIGVPLNEEIVKRILKGFEENRKMINRVLFKVEYGKKIAK